MADLNRENHNIRQDFTDKQAADAREMTTMSNELHESRETQLEMSRKLYEFSEEVAHSHKEAQNWKEVVHRMEGEARDMKKLVEELEFKNRRLNDRIYEQMNERAMSYKERTMQVLQTSHRPIPVSDLNQSEAQPATRPDLGRLSRGKNNSTSPLRTKSVGMSVPEQALPSYHVQEELKNSV